MSRVTRWLMVAALLLLPAGCSKKPDGKDAPATVSPVSQTSETKETEEPANADAEKTKPTLMDRVGSLFGSSKEEPQEGEKSVDVPAAVAASSEEASPPPDAKAEPPAAASLPAPAARVPAVVPEPEPHWALVKLRNLLSVFSIEKSPYWYLWLAGGWVILSVASVSVLEGIQPFSRPADNMLINHRIRLDEKSHPFAAAALFYIPVVWFLLANPSFLPSVSFIQFWKVIGIAVGTVVLVLGVWSMGVRWWLHIHFDFWEPFREARRMWLINVKKMPESTVTKDSLVEDADVEEWSRHWKQHSQRIGVSYHVPSWLNNKGLIAEWTFLFPLSVQHVIWVLAVRNGFWMAMDALAMIPRYTESEYRKGVQGQLKDFPDDTDSRRSTRY